MFSALPGSLLRATVLSAALAGGLIAQDTPDPVPAPKPPVTEPATPVKPDAAEPKAQDPKPSKSASKPVDASAGVAAKDARFRVGGKVDPGLTLTTLGGKPWSFEAAKDKTVFVHFWSGTCPFMKPAEPLIRQMAKEYEAQGVLFLAINSNRTELPASLDKGWESSRAASQLKRHVKDNELPYPMLLDLGNAAADRFRAHTTPHCFVIHKGVIEYAGALTDDSSGKKDEPTNYVALALDSVLAGKPVETPKTTPYGCSIKRVPASRKGAEGADQDGSKPGRKGRRSRPKKGESKPEGSGDGN